jgi:hypothetical protein
MLDEYTLAEKDKEHGGDRGKTWREDDDLHHTWPRLGNLMVFPVPRNHSLGTSKQPDLGFTEFNATGTGINTETLNRLLNLQVQDLPLTLGFRFRIRNKLGPPTDVWFTRTADDHVYIEDNVDDDGLEWLASYLTGDGVAHSAKDRQKLARWGATKLYEATKHMRIGKINMDY